MQYKFITDLKFKMMPFSRIFITEREYQEFNAEELDQIYSQRSKARDLPIETCLAWAIMDMNRTLVAQLYTKS